MNWVGKMRECDKSAYQHFFPLIFLFCYFKPRASLSQPWCFCRSFPWLFSTWFECVSMMVILLNCVTLGMYQPCEDMDCLSDRCKILQVSRFPSCCDGAPVQVTHFHACFPSACGRYLPREAGKIVPGSELPCCKMARACFEEGNGTAERMNELFLWLCNTEHLLIFLILHISRGFLTQTPTRYIGQG